MDDLARENIPSDRQQEGRRFDEGAGFGDAVEGRRLRSGIIIEIHEHRRRRQDLEGALLDRDSQAEGPPAAARVPPDPEAEVVPAGIERKGLIELGRDKVGVEGIDLVLDRPLEPVGTRIIDEVDRRVPQKVQGPAAVMAGDLEMSPLRLKAWGPQRKQ